MPGTKTIQNLLKVTVYRPQWCRGSRKLSWLLSKVDGTQCCLGFVANACGYKPEELLGVSEPEGVNNTTKFREHTSLISQRVCLELMLANDDPSISDAIREEKLKELGKKANIDFEFVG